MRSVTEYVDKAAEFDRMADAAPSPDLKKRFADMAECYRLLARERKRMIADGIVPLEPESGRPR